MEKQLKVVGNIIEFPDNKEMENKILEDKLYVAYEILRTIVKQGFDFNIVISKEASLELFDGVLDNLVLRTDKEFKLNDKSISYYTLEGDELD